MATVKTLREMTRDVYRGILLVFPYQVRIILDYLRREGRFPNIRRPQLHSEHLLRRALKDRQEILALLCSKEWVKEQVAAVLAGREVRISSTLWRGQGAEVPRVIEQLSKTGVSWVLKPNNLGGGVIYVPASGRIINESVADFVRRSEKVHKIYRNFAPLAWRSSEGGFIAEEKIGGSRQIDDFKVHVFGGTARIISVYSNRDADLRVNHFDANLRHIFSRNSAVSDLRIPRETARVLMELAEDLTFGLPYVRVDFYWSDGVIWFGEVSPYGSFDGLRHHRSLDRVMGSWWPSSSHNG